MSNHTNRSRIDRLSNPLLTTILSLRSEQPRKGDIINIGGIKSIISMAGGYMRRVADDSKVNRTYIFRVLKRNGGSVTSRNKGKCRDRVLKVSLCQNIYQSSLARKGILGGFSYHTDGRQVANKSSFRVLKLPILQNDGRGSFHAERNWQNSPHYIGEKHISQYGFTRT